MRIACLAWGSLLWDPRTLPMAGPFRLDGPMLPIEFCRVSLDGRVTLAIDPGAPAIRTYSVELAVGTLDEAISGLGVRERIAPDRWLDWIGVQTRDRPERNTGVALSTVREGIGMWLEDGHLDAVVWTALPERSPNGAEEHPSLEVLLDHLASLEGSALARAEEYVRRAPAATRTPRRERFETELGWTPTLEDATLRSGRGD